MSTLARIPSTIEGVQVIAASEEAAQVTVSDESDSPVLEPHTPLKSLNSNAPLEDSNTTLNETAAAEEQPTGAAVLQDQTNLLPFRQLIVIFAGLSTAMLCRSGRREFRRSLMKIGGTIDQTM